MRIGLISERNMILMMKMLTGKSRRRPTVSLLRIRKTAMSDDGMEEV